MGRNIFTTLFISVLLFTVSAAQAQTHEFQSMMMLSFLKYIQWPSEEAQTRVIIGVYGDREVFSFLGARYNNTTRYGKKVIVKEIKNKSEVASCNLLYVGKKKSDEFEQIARILQSIPVLLVTNDEGLGEKGSCINFKKVGDKMRFELNLEAISKYKLKVSSQLTNLAILI